MQSSGRGALARCVLQVAEAGSFADLGMALARGLGCGRQVDAVGLYFMGGPQPSLRFSRGAPPGFLAEYAQEHSRNDPLLDSLRRDRPVVDGPGVHGAAVWRRSAIFDLLRRWGYADNLCGGLWRGGELAGVLYAARCVADRQRRAAREEMELLCRAASLALPRIVETQARPAAGNTALPPRAALVARHLRAGMTNKEIAAALSISAETVKEHVAALRARMGARNRTELAARLGQAE